MATANAEIHGKLPYFVNSWFRM